MLWEVSVYKLPQRERQTAAYLTCTTVQKKQENDVGFQHGGVLAVLCFCWPPDLDIWTTPREQYGDILFYCFPFILESLL